MAEEHHTLQWGQTEHFGKQLAYLLRSTEDQDKMRKLFLEAEAFATVKFDGTNVGKCSVSGDMLGRRLTIPQGAERYQKTSLSRVIQAKVDVVREALIKDIGDGLGELVVYGELMCNKNLYDYKEQDLNEEWLVFGALAEDDSENEDILERLVKAGYAAALHGVGPDEKKRIQIFLNEKFVKIVEDAGMRTAKKGVVSKGTLAQIVEGNKEWLKEGKGEGLVVTVGGPSCGFQLLKWKGQQEHQPSSNDAVKAIVKEGQELGVDERIINIFKHMEEVIVSGPKVPPQIEKQKPTVQKDKICITENEVEAVKSAMTKFDDPETYFSKSMKMEYEKLILEEALKDVNTDDKMIHKALERQVKMVIGKLFGQYKSKQK